MNRQKRVLVLGATAALHYLFRTARDMGVYTIAVDGNPNAPSFALADEYEAIDIFDFDTLDTLCRKRNVDGIIGFGLDIVVLAAARLAQRLGLPGMDPETAERGTNKGLMKTAFKKAGIPTPDFRVGINEPEIMAALNELGLPAIIKPTDNAAKRGISVIRYAGDIPKAVRYALDNSREKKAIVEQFVEGQLVFAPTFVGDGVYHAGVMDQESTENLVQVRFTCPSCLPSPVQEDVRKYAVKCAQCLGIDAGGLHTEMIVSGDGIPWLIETSPRTSYATVALSRFVYGFDPVANTIRIALGQKTEIPDYAVKGAAVLQHLQPAPGTHFHRNKAEQVTTDFNIKELTFFAEDMAEVNPFRTNVDRVGYFVTSGSSYEALEDVTRQLKADLEKKLFY